MHEKQRHDDENDDAHVESEVEQAAFATDFESCKLEFSQISYQFCKYVPGLRVARREERTVALYNGTHLALLP